MLVHVLIFNKFNGRGSNISPVLDQLFKMSSVTKAARFQDAGLAVQTRIHPNKPTCLLTDSNSTPNDNSKNSMRPHLRQKLPQTRCSSFVVPANSALALPNLLAPQKPQAAAEFTSTNPARAQSL